MLSRGVAVPLPLLLFASYSVLFGIVAALIAPLPLLGGKVFYVFNCFYFGTLNIAPFLSFSIPFIVSDTLSDVFLVNTLSDFNFKSPPVEADLPCINLFRIASCSFFDTFLASFCCSVEGSAKTKQFECWDLNKTYLSSKTKILYFLHFS